MRRIPLTSRKSRPLPPMPKVRAESLQTRMLLEDVHNQVVPYRHKIEPYVVDVEEISNHAFEKAVTLNDQSLGIDDFLREVAIGLLRSHEVWIEVCINDGNTEGPPFEVCEVYGVKRTSTGQLVQEIPDKANLPDWFQATDDCGHCLKLDSDTMVHVSLPESYPSQVLERVIRDLANVHSISMPAWAMQHAEEGNADGPRFDISEASRTERLYILQAALPIGWTAREIYLDKSRQINEYYRHLRELRFLHFLASMRECAEAALREILTLAGKRCGFTASVTAHGVCTPDEVCEFIRRYRAAELPISAVTDIILQQAAVPGPEQRKII